MVVGNCKRIRCVVVAAPAEADAWRSRGALVHDLVPGADPYVALLIKRLQDEVRSERRALARVRSEKFTPVNRLTQSRSLSADLEIPWFDMPSEEDPFREHDDALPDFGGDANDDAAPAW
jgi:hypothetical protein